MEYERCPLCGHDAVKGTVCPLSIMCPDCKVGPGSWCKRPSDHGATQLHKARWMLAEDIDRQNGIGPEDIERLRPGGVKVIRSRGPRPAARRRTSRRDAPAQELRSAVA